MKKVLILTYDFPPYVSVGGLRPFCWYKYLYEYGVYPIVVTRQWSNKYGNQNDYISPGESSDTIIEESDKGTIIKTPYFPNLPNKLMLKYGESKFRFLRRLITAYYEFAQFSFLTGPKSQRYFAAKKYLKENNADAIIATGDPYVLFSYASKLSKKFNIPWIADYRDPWTQSITIKKNFFINLWNTHFERKIVRNAYYITTVSEFVKIKISSLIKNKNFFIIPNGYDPDAIEDAKGIEQDNNALNIAIVGTIYKWHPVKSVVGVLDDFIKNNRVAKLNLNFYGINITTEINEMIEGNFPDIKRHINIFPKKSNNEFLKDLARNNLMLLFNDYSAIGTKIYAYIGIKRTILLCYANDEEANKLKKKYYDVEEKKGLNSHLQEDFIKATNAGYIVQDAKHLYKLLEQLYYEFLTCSFIHCNTIQDEKFSRKYQTKVLADIIKNIETIKSANYQQCNRCVMDTSDPDIVFDENGSCNHCTDFFEKTSKLVYHGELGAQKIAYLVEKVKKSGKGNNYDCVTGVSGGVDSIYTAYIAKKLGLRPLAVHLDNGWDSEIAVTNIKKILNKLNIDLYTYILDWEEFRDLQLSFLKASVIEAETPTDIAIPAALHKVAVEHNIKYVFSGGNYTTEGILPKYWHYNAKDVRYLKTLHKKFGNKKLRTFPTFGAQKEFYYKTIKGIRMLYPLNYIPYNKKDAIKILEQELNWRDYGGKHHESLYTKFIQSYYLPEKFGIDYRRAIFSTQICNGEMTRNEALKELTNKPFDSIKVEEEKKYICKKLGLSINEFNEIMSLPPKTYKDYPNDEKRLKFIYKVYRKLYKSGL
ncbi:MAG: N-acetyl sugar amidotransferase [Bacteroidia bacterium]|nr:N-acetyl sugar amidotransferase [Bacteroidia bacterium]